MFSDVTFNRTYFETEDIFRYFEDLGKAEKLPSVEDLITVAETLHLRYSSLGAYHNAMRANSGHPSLRVPVGSLWSEPEWLVEKRRQDAEEEMRKQEAKEMMKSNKNAKGVDAIPKPPPPPFLGDSALGESQRFMADTILSRIVSEAVAAGLVGTVWEIEKVCHCIDAHGGVTSAQT